MNWSRGLFRLWLLLAVVWVAGVVFVGLNYSAAQVTKPIGVTMDSSTKNVTAVRAFSTAYHKAYIDKTNTQIEPTDMERVIFFLPTSVTKDEMTETLALMHAKATIFRQAEEREKRWESIVALTLFALLPPILLFGFGFAVVWAFRGFQSLD